MLILLVLPLVVLLNIPSITDHGGSSMYLTWLARLALAAIILFFGYRYVRARVIDPVRASHRTREVQLLDRQLAYELQREAAADAVSRRQAALFMMALRTPAKIRQRIVEKYTPGQRTLSNHASIEIQVPRVFLETDQVHDPADFLHESFPFPMFVPPKSVMYDNLEIFDKEGARLSTLSYREFLSLIAGVLRYLLTGAYGGKLPGNPELFYAAESVEVDALERVIKRRNDRRLSKEQAAEMDLATERVVARLLNLDGVDAAHRHYLELAADLVRILSKRYAIVAPLSISSNGRTLVSYKRSVIPALKEPGVRGNGRAGKAKEYLRHLLGARPVDVSVALENAGICHSYHIEVQSPEGLYLASQQIMPEPETFPEPANLTSQANQPYQFKPHYRFRSRLGQSYGHFYSRHFPDPDDAATVPKVEFSFYEVPPGSDFQAAVAAASAAFLIGLIGFVLSHSRPGPDGHFILGSDAPVLLLAFPGVAASWLGIDQAGVRLFDSSLSARVSLVGTVMFSVMASALYIINSSDVEPHIFDQKLTAGISLLGIDRCWWVGLTALAVINTLCIAYRWFYRSWRYAHLARRNPSG